LLNLAISDSLDDPHVLEVRRLPFALKVDIAAALRLIQERDLLLAVNGIRNRFAHNRGAELTKKDADALRSASGPHVREFVLKSLKLPDQAAVNVLGPLAYLERVVTYLFYSLEIGITEQRDQKARMEILIEIANEPRERLRAQGRPSERARAAVESEREKRLSRGDL
jgi:hypothetical protein